MRFALIVLALTFSLVPAFAQDKPADGPTNEKAQKTYKNAQELLHGRMPSAALDEFKKADKQDSGHCHACQKQMIKYGIELGEWKDAELAAEEMIADAQGDRATALAHYQYAVILLNEGQQKHKDEIFAHAHDEATKALAAAANFPDAIYLDGRALAQLKQDDAAKARFEQYAKMKAADDPVRPARGSLRRQSRTGACPHGAALRCHHARWAAHFHGRPPRKSCADRFLGYLVRSVSGSSAACPRPRQKISGSAARHPQRKPR